MVSKELYYTFTEQVGPSQYSEEYDEEFYDTEDFEWYYTVYEDDIANAFIDMFGDKKETLENNVKSVIQQVMSQDELNEMLEYYDSDTIEQAIEEVKKVIADYNSKLPAAYSYKARKVDAYNLLDYLLADISYYSDKYEDEIKDYFYDAAHQEFLENY